jgi:hypothetical protein
VLVVRGNGTVLRGEDRARTRLLFSAPLDRALGVNVKDAHSRWEWAGGLIWFAPRSRDVTPHLGSGEVVPERTTGGSWPVGPPLASVVAPASRGERRLLLSGAGSLRAGDLVFLVLDAAPALLDAGWRREQDVRHPGGRIPGPAPGAGTIRWPVEIAAVAGDAVTLAQPLRFDLPAALHPHLHAVRAEGVIRDVGIERLSLIMRRQPPPPGLAEPFGWNGPFFQLAVHAFARDLTVVDSDLGVLALSSKNLTVSDVDLLASAAPPAPAATSTPSQHAVTLRAHSHDVLVERVRFDPRRWRGLRIEGTGVVLSKTVGCLGHLRGPLLESVLTETLDVPCPPAALEDAGAAVLLGQRVVGWNLRAQASPDARAAGHVPPNLYEAQKALRLRRPAPIE